MISTLALTMGHIGFWTDGATLGVFGIYRFGGDSSDSVQDYEIGIASTWRYGALGKYYLLGSGIDLFYLVLEFRIRLELLNLKGMA